MPVDFSRFMVSGRKNRFEPLPETVIPRLKMPVVAEPAPAPYVAPAPIPQISPEVLAQIQQQFNLPAAPPAPPVAPPVQVPPPVMQPAPAPAPEPTNKNFTAEELVSEYNNSRGAQDFSLTATYDPATNTFVEDVSAFGFEGDAATKQYTPEEFMDRLGYESSASNTFSFTPPDPSSQQLLDMYNNSPAASDFDLKASYDPDTNTYTEDVSSFGFEGDAATKEYTPEEFMDRIGYEAPTSTAPMPEVVTAPPEGIATLPQAPVEPPAPPVQVPPPVVQPEPLAGPGMPTPSGGFLAGIDLSNLDLSGLAVPNQVQPAVDPSLYSDPTGIETMAESVGQGDYLGIPLPDGSTFDLSTLDLSSIGGEGGMGNVDPSLYSDPGLGGGPRGEPLPDTRGGGPGFDPFAGVTGGLGPGGYGPEGGGFAPGGEPAFNMGDIGFGPVGVEGGYSYDGNGNVINGGPAPGGEPVFNPPQGAIDEAQGTTYTGNNFTPDLSGLNLDFSNLDLSGLDLGNLNIGGEGGAGNNSYNPEDQGGPGRGNGPGFTMGGTDASGNGNTNTGSADTGSTDTNNPYPFIPPGINTSGMTPENLAGLNSFYEMYPNGFDYNGLDLSGIGNIDLSGVYPGGTGTDDGSYTVTPVDPVGDLGVGDDAGSDPIDVTTPYVPPETRAASSYGLTGAVQTMPVAANPFRRPEAQQGIGSLAGGG
jgi:hypothetical protein